MVKRGFILTFIFIFIYSLSKVWVEITMFDKSYSVINKTKDVRYENSRGERLYNFYLICQDDIGRFKIDVDEKTYNSYKRGSNIRFDREFSSFDLYEMSYNEETKNNLLKLLKEEEKFLVKNDIFILIFSAFLIISPLMIIHLIVSLYKEYD